MGFYTERQILHDFLHVESKKGKNAKLIVTELNGGQGERGDANQRVL